MAATAGRLYAGLTPAEREHRRRERFLGAGLEVFSAKGWASATVLDICQSAQLSQRYFYELFPSREALFLAVVSRIADEVERVVRDAGSATGTTPEQRARGVLEALAAYFSGDPRTVRVALVESCPTAEFLTQRAQLLASFSALAAQLMRAFHPRPSRADQ